MERRKVTSVMDVCVCQHRDQLCYDQFFLNAKGQRLLKEKNIGLMW